MAAEVTLGKRKNYTTPATPGAAGTPSKSTVITPKKPINHTTPAIPATPATPIVHHTPQSSKKTTFLNTFLIENPLLLDTISINIQELEENSFNDAIKDIFNQFHINKLNVLSINSRAGIVFKYTREIHESYIFKICFITDGNPIPIISEPISNTSLTKDRTLPDRFENEAKLQLEIYNIEPPPNNIVPPITTYGILDHTHPFIKLLSLNKDNRIFNIMQQTTHKYGVICMPYLEDYYTLSAIEKKCKEQNMDQFFNYYVNLARLALVILYNLGYEQGDETMDNIMINPYERWLDKSLLGRPMIIDFGRGRSHHKINKNPNSILDELCTKHKSIWFNQDWICKDYNIEQFMLFYNKKIHKSNTKLLEVSTPQIERIFENSENSKRPKNPKFEGGNLYNKKLKKQTKKTKKQRKYKTKKCV